MLIVQTTDLHIEPPPILILPALVLIIATASQMLATGTDCAAHRAEPLVSTPNAAFAFDQTFTGLAIADFHVVLRKIRVHQGPPTDQTSTRD
jgi:hypothetical protein